MNANMLSLVSPSEIYGKLLSRQLRSANAILASIWALDAVGVFLYAAVGDRCDEIFSDMHAICSEIAASAMEKDVVIEKQIGSMVVLAIPIRENGSPYACSLLWSRDGRGFETEERELAIVGTEAFSVYMEQNKLSRPTYKLAEGCLTLTNVTKVYGSGEGAVKALNGVNLSIRRGELLVILGMSGSGKSTLLNIIGGMTKPTSGSVKMESGDITLASDAELTSYRRSKLGFIFQFYNLISDLTAWENVSIAAGLSENPMPVDEALNYVGLLGKKDKYPSQMSGGEQQRVSIARAIVKQTEFLLCDEPTGALDIDTGKQVLKLLAKLVSENGQTAVIVTHCAAIASMADRVIRIRNGRIVEEYINCEKLSPDEIEW